MRLVTLIAAVAAAVHGEDGRRVLVSGATGRTGSILYRLLKADSSITEVRALVRNATKAKEVLGCDKCDASEGIYVGDVTERDSMLAAAEGCDTLAIATGVGGKAKGPLMKEVEFFGVENQADALASQRKGNVSLASLRIVLISSMGTTVPNVERGGDVFFWKLNAEAFLGGSGIPSIIVKPCGLNDGPSGQHALKALHDDKRGALDPFMIARADVAAVVKQAVVERSSGLRFGVCNAHGPAGTDLSALLKSARWPWQQ